MTIFKQSASIPSAVGSLGSIGVYANAVEGVLPLNGPLFSFGATSVSFLEKGGYFSSLDIVSAGDLSAVHFTIKGRVNGNDISETLAGPNAGIVTTDILFDVVSSISIDGNIGGPFSIGSGDRVAVLLEDKNSKAGITHPNYLYSISVTSVLAQSQVNAGELLIYGIGGSGNISLTQSNLNYNTRPNTYMSLFPVTSAIPVAELNEGILINSPYPYSAVIVYMKPSVNEFSTFVEITQS